MEPRCRRGGLGGEGVVGTSSWRGAALEEPTYLRAFGAFLARSQR
jgi:Pyruvate/2-oxoacid:ferredoxin oxidoreductase gamma subunit